MPIERQYFKTFRVFFAHLAEQAERQRESEHEKSHDHVGRVQTDERVKGSAKQICADGKTIFVDELVPLPCRAREEKAAQQYCRGQPQRAQANLVLSQCSNRKIYGLTLIHI